EALYDRPKTRFVANFLGEANFFEGTDFKVQSDVVPATGMVAMLRPERTCVTAPNGPRRSDAERRQSTAGVIEDMIYAGPLRKYRVRVGDTVLIAREHVASGQDVFGAGDEVRVDWLRSDVRFVTA
ncbi:TOBE domain-containing protein, partial [Rhizobium giardinii]|uniref:TOBE domain-containing protein n=1 Tax=Rhizobium giardinii TaxID=56731 RepID=UPI000367AD4C